MLQKEKETYLQYTLHFQSTNMETLGDDYLDRSYPNIVDSYYDNSIYKLPIQDRSKTTDDNE